MQYVAAAMDAEAGNVTTQAMAISRPTFHRTEPSRKTAPTPKMAPVIVCVVLTGIPKADRARIVTPPPVSAQKPLTGCSLVTLCPRVLMTFHPPS